MLGCAVLGSGLSALAAAAPAAPTAGCNTFTDLKGDASIVLEDGAPGTPNDPDLDLTGLVLQSTPDAFNAFVRVDKLNTRAQYAPGHSFYVLFTLNKKIVSLIGTAYDPATISTVVDAVASATASFPSPPGPRAPVTRMLVDGVYVPSSLTAAFDLKTSLVTLSIKRADLDKVAGAGGLADGTVLTKVNVRSLMLTPAGGLFLDATAKDNAAVTTDAQAWTVGNNACFTPPPPPLASVGAVTAQYRDSAPVAAKLVDAAGAPVVGAAISFAVGTAKATATTGADGVAKAALVIVDKAGVTSLSLTSGDKTLSVPFTIKAEKTALKATGSAGAVTATLTDDDLKAVPGQVLVFVAGSKKVSVKTSAKGIAKATGFPVGSTVKVTYAGLVGMYLSSATSAKA